MMKSVRMFLWLTFLTGVMYPLLITAIAWLTMHKNAEGSLLVLNGKTVGSTLIGQKFESEKYFWGRPSAVDYHTLPSGASNLGPTSAPLKKLVEQRREFLQKAYSVEKDKIPSELLFASGSGLDPHIHVETAYFQMERVAKARGLKTTDLKNLIDRLVIHPRFLFLGIPHVNVLLLNIALDGLTLSPK